MSGVGPRSRRARSRRSASPDRSVLGPPRRRAGWAWLVLLLSGIGGEVRAQELASPGIAADRFQPGIGPAALLQVEGADVTPRGRVSFAVGLGYLREPLRLVERETGAILSRPVKGQLVADLGYELGLGRVAIAVGLPVVLHATGDRLRGTGIDERPLQTVAAGDLRLRMKVPVIGDPLRRGLHAATVLQLTAPMGGQDHFAATASVTIEPRILVDYRFTRGAVAAQVGVRFAAERQLFGTTFGDELGWAAGGVLRVLGHGLFHGLLVAEAAGAVGISQGNRPVELRGAVRAWLKGFSIDLGAGGGVVAEAQAPAWRIFVLARGLFPEAS